MVSEGSDRAPRTAQDPETLARMRTALAVERTVFAVIRTGLAIAGGGTVIISLLGSRWPPWLQAVLATGFIVPGYALMIDGLNRYRRVAAETRDLDPEHHRIVSPGLMSFMISLVQIVVLVVLVLFVFDAFESEVG